LAACEYGLNLALNGVPFGLRFIKKTFQAFSERRLACDESVETAVLHFEHFAMLPQTLSGRAKVGRLQGKNVTGQPGKFCAFGFRKRVLFLAPLKLREPMSLLFVPHDKPLF
jgi:hypothetical protein